MRINLTEVTPKSKELITRFARQNNWNYDICASDSFFKSGDPMYDIKLYTGKDLAMVSCTETKWGIYNSDGSGYITFPKNSCLKMIVGGE